MTSFSQFFGRVIVGSTLIWAGSAAATITSLSDDFNTEFPQGNHTNFVHWDVSNGAVDTVVTGGGIVCSGVCVDLDGSNSDAGKITTKDDFALGSYNLSFDLSGNQRNNGLDSVIVNFGDFNQQIDLPDTQTSFLTYNFVASVIGSPAKLSFEGLGGDNVGLLLDNVSVSSVPGPAIPGLFLLSFGALAARRILGST